mgnify:CR=1 FL=1
MVKTAQADGRRVGQDDFTPEAQDKSRLQLVLEYIFNPRHRWPMRIVTVGTGLIAVLSWSKVIGGLFILIVILTVVARAYLAITSTRTFRRLFKARRLYLTTEGWWFIIFTIAIGTAAMNTGVNLLYLILSMMLSSIVISGILSETTFHKISISRSAPYSVFAGERFEVTLQVHNRKALLPSFSLFVEDSPGAEPILEKTKACFALKIPSRSSQTLEYSAVIKKRGPFMFNGYRVHSGYPFNFFNKHMRLPGTSSTLVYPRLYELNHVEVLSGGERADALRKLHLRAQGEEDFRGLKEFRHGDNPRRIHWPTSARQRKLMVKEFEKQRANRVMVILDTFVSVPSPERLEVLERAISTAASLITFFERRSYQTGFASFTPRLTRVRPDSGRRHYFALMEVLAKIEFSSRGIDELADRLDARLLRDSMVFLITLRKSPRCDEALRILDTYSGVMKHICVTGDDFSKYVIVPEDSVKEAQKTNEPL